MISRKEQEHPKANLTDFKEKLSGFQKILSYKYPNMLHEWMIPESTEQRDLEAQDKLCICNKEMYEEAFTEYYAIKYAGLYDDISHYRGHSMGKEKVEK